VRQTGRKPTSDLTHKVSSSGATIARNKIQALQAGGSAQTLIANTFNIQSRLQVARRHDPDEGDVLAKKSGEGRRIGSLTGGAWQRWGATSR
jgi:hypothetical protein